MRRLESTAARADSAYDLASIVIAIGRLGGDTRAWLDDPRPGVHGAAALAPALTDDRRATEILIELSRSPETFTASFGDSAPPHHFTIGPQREIFAEALHGRIRGWPAKDSPGLGTAYSGGIADRKAKSARSSSRLPLRP